MKGKTEEIQRGSARRFDKRKRLAEYQRNDYQSNPPKRFKLEEESFDYTFTMPLEKIYAELKDQGIFCSPKPYNIPDHMMDRSQYCIFQEDYGHTLVTCRNLYFQLKSIMKKGELQM